MTHKIEAIGNRGWDDDPDWALVCECGWEAWDGRSEQSVRHLHAQHAREHGWLTPVTGGSAATESEPS